jgi:hypothetical protein
MSLRLSFVCQSASNSGFASMRLCHAGDQLIVVGGIGHVGHDLRAAQAGVLSFLMEPATGRSDLEGGKRIYDRQQAFDDALRQGACAIIEMFAAARHARGRDAENLGRLPKQ